MKIIVKVAYQKQALPNQGKCFKKKQNEKERSL